MLGFWILQDCQYARVSKVTQGLAIFVNKYVSECKYGRFMNIPRYEICQLSSYASITQGSEYAWIWPKNSWINKQFWLFSQGFECSSSSSVPGLRIRQTCEYARVTQRVEYAWIIQNMLECAYIYLNKQSSEFAKILNMSYAVYSLRSLYKLLSSYWGKFPEHRQAFKTERFAKIIMPECTRSTRSFSL